MGLFDKKKKGRDEEFDSPVEEVDLDAPDPAAPRSQARGEASEAGQAETVEPASSPSPIRGVQVAAIRPGEPERRRTHAQASPYGIDDAVALMRALPNENIELVVQVVKHTLESAKIDIGGIIDDATAKQQRIEARINVLRDAIAELEREIDTRRVEIAQLESEHRETSRVRERLLLAEKLTQSGWGETVADSQVSRGRGSESSSQATSGSQAASMQRNKSTSTPPPTPAPSSPPGTASTPGHAASSLIQGPVGPSASTAGSNSGASSQTSLYGKHSSSQTSGPKK